MGDFFQGILDFFICTVIKQQNNAVQKSFQSCFPLPSAFLNIFHSLLDLLCLVSVSLRHHFGESWSNLQLLVRTLQLIFHFQCFMFNAAGLFIKVKMSVEAEGRPEAQSQRRRGCLTVFSPKISLFVAAHLENLLMVNILHHIK